MKTTTYPLLAIFPILAFGVGVPEASAAPMDIVTCGPITESGSYKLANNLAATGDCLVIAARRGFVVVVRFEITWLPYTRAVCSADRRGV